MGVQVFEKEGEKKGGVRREKTSNVKMTGTPRVSKNRAQDFITHTWTAESMETPLLSMNSAVGLVREIIRIKSTKWNRGDSRTREPTHVRCRKSHRRVHLL